MAETKPAPNVLIRPRQFHLATKEKIVGINYYPGQAIDINVAVGEDRGGLFEQVPGSHPETYQLNGDALRRALADQDLKDLLTALEARLWANIDEIRADIVRKRTEGI
ncbi:hypothetical protein [Nitrosomonas halophila]|uniref:Uncharacterized protein n=1 Tax=Nitrosomonas halophila TaxID=44576 RepID=A0A1H3FAC0_9PROT|nr:hypothetical protein [Nitrosomonas halophila]SDX87911.1 hypothetical protein SAMN05421881_101131 [Nitrosomonas halophila]